MTTTFNTAATKTVRVNGTNFVYREIGNKSGFPVVFLHHLTAVLEDWDPAIADGLAKGRPVIIFDNRGVGGSEGKTPDTVADMAKDALAFIGHYVLGLGRISPGLRAAFNSPVSRTKSETQSQSSAMQKV